MTSVSVVSQKGGVGKTTVSLNLSFAFAKRGSRVLLVDLDPQGAVGLSLAGRARSAPGFSAWRRSGGPAAEHVLHTKLPQLDLLPYGPADFEALCKGGGAPDAQELSGLLKQVEADYDLILFDTPAGVGGATSAALQASDYALIPLQAEPLALRTLPAILQGINTLKEGSEASAVLLAVLLTMTSLRDPVSLGVTQEVWSELPEELVLETHVPRDRVFAEASAEGVPVGLLRRKAPPVASVFDLIASELEDRLGLSDEGGDGGPIHLLD